MKVLGLSPESLGVTKFACDPKQDEDASCFNREEIVRNRHVFAELVTQLAADDPHKPFYTELYMFVYNVHPETMDFKVCVKRIEAYKNLCESIIKSSVRVCIKIDKVGVVDREVHILFFPSDPFGHSTSLTSSYQIPNTYIVTTLINWRFLCFQLQHHITNKCRRVFSPSLQYYVQELSAMFLKEPGPKSEPNFKTWVKLLRPPLPVQKSFDL